MEDYVKETLIASPYPFWLTTVIFVIIMGIIQFIISYFTIKGKYKAMIEEIHNLSYNQEKGKNLATKEDIEEITRTVESIRNEISIQKQRETEYLYKRNECFLEFLNCLDELDLYKMKISRISNTLGVPNISYQYLCDLENYILRLSKQYRLLIVYNPNKKSEEHLLNIYNTTNKLSNFLYNIIFRFYNENILFTDAINSFPKGNQNAKIKMKKSKEKARKIIEEYNKDRDELYKKYREVVDEYNLYLGIFFDAKLHLRADFPTE